MTTVHPANHVGAQRYIHCDFNALRIVRPGGKSTSEGVSEGGGVTAQGGHTPTFPLTHLQQTGLTHLQEEVLVFLIFFIINYVDLNSFAGNRQKGWKQEERRTGSDVITEECDL